MDLIRYVVKAVVLEGLSVREVASAHGVFRSWVYECLARYRAEGEQGLHPRSRRPRSSPSRLAAEIEEEIVPLRKDLAGQGLDAGPQTIAWHLAQHHDQVPSAATIWRVLRRRGLITPQPQKRPRRRTCGSARTCRTSAGRWTSLTGSWPPAPAWRSSTSSTITCGSSH